MGKSCDNNLLLHRKSLKLNDQGGLSSRPFIIKEAKKGIKSIKEGELGSLFRDQINKRGSRSPSLEA
jgi:hypothetical protein